MISYHPGLPSLSMAAKNYNSVASDHVPILATIPNKIKIISWNVLSTDSANGFAPLGKGSYGETEQQMLDRYDRIASGLAKMVEKNAPHFICLQEIRCDTNKQLYSRIKAKLPDYAITENNGMPIDFEGCITLYNTKQFEPAPGIEKKQVKDFKCGFLQGNKTEFVDKKTQLKIVITNAHPDFDEIPRMHEEEITTYLAQKGPNILSIVVGDFNCTIAPLDSVPRNITTVATVSTFRNNQLQGAGAVDGCFYTDVEYNQRDFMTFRQAPISHLNWQTGEPYDARLLAPINVHDLSELQKKEINRFEMVISIDEFWNDQKIAGKYNANVLEAYLKQGLGDQGLMVRQARNSNNEKGIGVTLTRACYEHLVGLNDSRLTCRVKPINGVTPAQYIVLTSEANTPFLLQQIESFCKVNVDQAGSTHSLYYELQDINDDYADHLKENPSTSPVDIKIHEEKVAFVKKISELLESKKDKSAYEKQAVIVQIHKLLKEDKTISQYRGPDWARYLRNMGVALACTILFPVGATAAIISKVKYNTFQFWQTTGYKKSEHMQKKISSYRK